MWLGSFFMLTKRVRLLINTEQGVSASFPVPVRLVLFIAIPENNAKNSAPQSVNYCVTDFRRTPVRLQICSLQFALCSTAFFALFSGLAIKTGKKKALSIWAEPSCFPSILLSSLSNISAPVQTPDTRWLLQAYSSQHHLTGSSRALLRAALFPASCLWKTPHRRSTILSEETEPPPAAIRRTGETAEYFPQNTGPAAAGFPRFQTASHPRPFSNPVLWKTA